MKWKSRRGLQGPDAPSTGEEKHAAFRTGVRGATYADWYLRRHGYLFIARNCSPARAKGEIDLIGFDGDTLAFVEPHTRGVSDGKTALPELSITPEKHPVLVRTAHYFLLERQLLECPARFAVIAIDNIPGKPPVVRLHKVLLCRQAKFAASFHLRTRQLAADRLQADRP